MGHLPGWGSASQPLSQTAVRWLLSRSERSWGGLVAPPPTGLDESTVRFSRRSVSLVLALALACRSLKPHDPGFAFLCINQG